jgi:hypothetical protein
MKIGVHRSMSYDTYAALPAVRSSHLKGFARSAAHAREQILNDTETAAKVLGQALHVALLEPEVFAKTYVAAPKLDKRTVAGKREWADFQADNAGKLALTKAEMDECLALADAAHGHPIAAGLISEAKALREVTLVWQDDGTKLFCKARLDLLTYHEGVSTILDVKTTRDASPLRFAADAARFGYHIQAAWYLRGADALSPVPRRYFLLALEKEAPHALMLHELDEAFLAEGRAQCEKALVAYKHATESNVWPGYPTRINTLRAPGWLKPDEDDTDE